MGLASGPVPDLLVRVCCCVELWREFDTPSLRVKVWYFDSEYCTQMRVLWWFWSANFSLLINVYFVNATFPTANQSTTGAVRLWKCASMSYDVCASFRRPAAFGGDLGWRGQRACFLLTRCCSYLVSNYAQSQLHICTGTKFHLQTPTAPSHGVNETRPKNAFNFCNSKKLTNVFPAVWKKVMRHCYCVEQRSQS